MHIGVIFTGKFWNVWSLLGFFWNVWSLLVSQGMYYLYLIRFLLRNNYGNSKITKSLINYYLNVFHSCKTIKKKIFYWPGCKKIKHF